jgi:hypothetical protein
VPDLVAADVTGGDVGDGAPAVLMSMLSGGPSPCPRPSAGRGNGAGPRRRPCALRPRVLLLVPRRHGRPSPDARRPWLWERAIEAWHTAMPNYRPVFIHRDFPPGNVLWARGRCTGMVDGPEACRGPAGCDVAHCRSELIRPAGISVAAGFRAAYEGITGEPQHPDCEIGSVMEHGPPHWNAGNLVQAERRLALVLAAMGVQTSPERLQPPGPLSAAPVRPAFDCPAASHTPSWFPHPPSARWSNRPYLRRSAGPAQTQPLHAGSTGGKATAPKVARVIPAWE